MDRCCRNSRRQSALRAERFQRPRDGSRTVAHVAWRRAIKEMERGGENSCARFFENRPGACGDIPEGSLPG